MVDFEVAKLGIRGLPRSELPSAWGVFKERWHLVLPLVLLVYLLVWVQYTPIKSAFISIVSVLVISSLRAATRPSLTKVAEGLRQGAMSMLEVAAACACAGIIIGVMMISGLALRLSSLLIEFSGGSLIVLMFLTMLVSLILGMGLPTSAVYVVLAVLVVPAMTDMGVNLLAAHMFVFYFGVLANVTPPVAIAAYAGAGLAGAKSSDDGLDRVSFGAGRIHPAVHVGLQPGLDPAGRNPRDDRRGDERAGGDPGAVGQRAGVSVRAREMA